MADTVFVFCRQLGYGAAEFGQVEIRVVTETTLASCSILYFAIPHAIGHQRLWIIGMAHQCQDTDELSAALLLRHILERFEQLCVVRCIALAIGIACAQPVIGPAVERDPWRARTARIAVPARHLRQRRPVVA